MMVPPGTICPPNALNPIRCAFESRPFREVPCPFLCAIKISFRWPVASKIVWGRATRPSFPLLLLRSGLLSRLLGSCLLLRVRLSGLFFRFVLLHCRGLLHLRLLLFQLQSLKTLP